MDCTPCMHGRCPTSPSRACASRRTRSTDSCPAAGMRFVVTPVVCGHADGTAWLSVVIACCVVDWLGWCRVLQRECAFLARARRPLARQTCDSEPVRARLRVHGRGVRVQLRAADDGRRRAATCVRVLQRRNRAAGAIPVPPPPPLLHLSSLRFRHGEAPVVTRPRLRCSLSHARAVVLCVPAPIPPCSPPHRCTRFRSDRVWLDRMHPARASGYFVLLPARHSHCCPWVHRRSTTRRLCWSACIVCTTRPSTASASTRASASPRPPTSTCACGRSTSPTSSLRRRWRTRATRAVVQYHDAPLWCCAECDGFIHKSAIALYRLVCGVQHEEGVTSCAVSPDGIKVAVATANGNVGVLDVSTHAYQCLMRSHSKDIIAIAPRLYAGDGSNGACNASDVLKASASLARHRLYRRSLARTGIDAMRRAVACGYCSALSTRAKRGTPPSLLLLRVASAHVVRCPPCASSLFCRVRDVVAGRHHPGVERRVVRAAVRVHGAQGAVSVSRVPPRRQRPRVWLR
jgi:hypothetical protein